MRMLFNITNRIPRQIRTICNAVLILLLAVIFYTAIGAPPVTREQAFRRAEKANLTGPSAILLSEDLEHYDYDHLILAHSQYGVTTYVSSETWHPILCYTEKNGDVTVITAPKGVFNWGSHFWEVQLPVFVVDDVPDAVRAELEIDITGTYVHNLNGEQLQIPLDHHYALEATREHDHFFRFSIGLPSLGQYDESGYDTNAVHGAEGYALDLLAETFSNRDNRLPHSSASITAAVRLYGKSDNLLTEQTLTLREINETD